MLQQLTDVAPLNALQYGMFVKTAYDVYGLDPNNPNPPQTSYRTLPDGYEVKFNIQMQDFFDNSNDLKYYGFFAQNTTTGEYVVAIRGTLTWEEWWDDFHIDLTLFPYYNNGAYVAEGFLTIYETIRLTVPSPKNGTPVLLLKDTAADPTLLKPDGTLTLVAAGHSLGAALITLYAADITSRGNDVQPTVYTYASPRVGDTTFADTYNANVDTNYRIYNYPDLVPRIPKDPFDNYQQVKGGYEVNSLNKKNIKWTPDCFHALGTHLYLLGGSATLLGDCIC